jgi:peptide methionine sulfoxide reductase MsrA
MTDNTATAILAGGCFWGMQELLRHRDGVISARVGYTGVQNERPTYMEFWCRSAQSCVPALPGAERMERGPAL